MNNKILIFFAEIVFKHFQKYSYSKRITLLSFLFYK